MSMFRHILYDPVSIKSEKYDLETITNYLNSSSILNFNFYLVHGNLTMQQMMLNNV